MRQCEKKKNDNTLKEDSLNSKSSKTVGNKIIRRNSRMKVDESEKSIKRKNKSRIITNKPKLNFILEKFKTIYLIMKELCGNL